MWKIPRSILNCHTCESGAHNRDQRRTGRCRSGPPRDAAFVAEAPTGGELASLPLFTERLTLISFSGHALVRKPQDVAYDSVIAFPNGCAYRRRCTAGWETLAARPQGHWTWPRITPWWPAWVRAQESHWCRSDCLKRCLKQGCSAMCWVASTRMWWHRWSRARRSSHPLSGHSWHTFASIAPARRRERAYVWHRSCRRPCGPWLSR